MARTRELGRAGASIGWRKQLADRLAPAVAKRSRFDRDDVRAAVGIAFFAASVLYVAQTLRELRRRSE